MLTPEAHLPDKSIHEALVNDAKRPKLVETLPSWMSRESKVRFGDTDIALDETRLPRLEGFMGAAHLLRKGQAEFKQEAFSPANTPANKEQSGALLAVKAILEMAGLYGGAQAMKKGRGKNGLLFLGGLGLMAGSGVGLTMDLSGCGPQAIETPPAIVTEAPATAMAIETSTPSLGNEVLTGTPSSVAETPAPVGSVYPAEVSSMTDPKVYSYGGVEGRANMNEYARAMFDRYIAEMARSGLITGSNVEQLYQSFDSSGFDFKLFTTDAGQTWLVQSRDGGFHVPKTQDGQMFRDLQLSYDYLFQNGVQVDAGVDNFDLQKFQVNRVGFVGAWPVLVNIDAQNVPVNWVNMEQGGATSPIVLASTTATPETAPATAIPDSRVDLAVGGETFRVTTDVLYTEAATNLNIDPSKAQKIGEQLVYVTDFGRLIWNEHMAAWTPEFPTSMDYEHSDTAPVVPFDAYYDGSPPDAAVYIPSSVTLSDRLYFAEHPGVIAPDAAHPHYKVNMENTFGYMVSIYPVNDASFPPSELTQVTFRGPKPFEYFGIQQTEDSSGRKIVVIKKANWNPDAADPSNTILPTNMGMDKFIYDQAVEYPLMFKYLTDSREAVGQMMPFFLPPSGSSVRPEADFREVGSLESPAVFALQSQNDISVFPQEVQSAILAMYPRAGENFEATTNPKSINLAEFPSGLSNMILYTIRR